MVDKIIKGKTRTRREFCSFYTESDPILNYMVKKLDVESGDLILEPCAGDGVFIDKIINLNKNKKLSIEALDLNEIAVKNLKTRFNGKSVSVRQADTLLDETLNFFNNSGRYTKIIGNPPYGAWQDYKKRATLKKLYGGYVRETYTLFLRRCLNLLKEGGRLVFIVPDTFLSIHVHKNLRKLLLENTVIEEILLIPSNFFPGVNFGYSNLCIISFIKQQANKKNYIKIISVKGSVKNLYKITEGNCSIPGTFESIPQQEILSSLDYSFFLGGNPNFRKLINEAETRLGDIAECVTGFYSGDNKTFLAVRNNAVRGGRGHKVLDTSLVDNDFLNKENLINGLNNKNFIPVLKGGNIAFLKDTDWFVQWDKEAVSYYRKNKASRFQNSQYYFREGIGVPMVKTNKVRAFLLERRLFDQSIVGVFPKNNKYLFYILAFLNSDVCSKILNIINHTANNSANYLKKLPIILDTKAIKRSGQIITDLKNKKVNIFEALAENNILFNNLFSQSKRFS